jgi:hypothetical protein
LNEKHIPHSTRWISSELGCLKLLDELSKLNGIKFATLTSDDARCATSHFNFSEHNCSLQEARRTFEAIKNYSEPFKLQFASEDSLIRQKAADERRTNGKKTQ